LVRDTCELYGSAATSTSPSIPFTCTRTLRE
jgi:hypothetical protein